MREQSTLDRYKIFAERKAKAFFKSLETSRLVGRFEGPKVLVNSVPKAGTNLLDRVLYEMPGMRFSGKRTFRKMTHTKPQLKRALLNTGKGEYNLAHIEYDQEVSDLMIAHNIKSFLMIRDPRSILVSHLKYVTYMDTNHKTHAYFKNLKSDEDRLKAIILGVPDIVEPIVDILNSYGKWAEKSDSLLIRFEDLIGEKGGGTSEKQLMVINEIAIYLNIPINNLEVQKIAKKVFTSKSPTFRSGRIRNWESEFSESNKTLLKRNIGEWLIKYNYEKDNNW